MDAKTARLKNLRILLERNADEGRTKAEFARRVGTAAAYISQLLSKTTKAEMGDDLARRIESEYRLPNGYMDHDHDAQRVAGEFRRVPLLDMTKMTTWRAAVQTETPTLAVAIPASTGSTIHAYRVTGSAMAPDYPAGCAAVVNPELTTRPGDCVIASLGDGRVVFRRLEEEAGTSYLTAIDPRQPIIRRSEIVEMLVVSDVVHSLRK